MVSGFSLNRLINRLHPESPKRCVTIGDAIRLDRAHLPDSIIGRNLLTCGETSSLNIARARPLTSEDNILDCDVIDHAELSFDSRFLYEFVGARVVPNQGDLITRDGELLTDFSLHNQGDHYHNGLLRRTYPKTLDLIGNTLNMVTPYSDNYYHWLFDALPTIKAVADLGISIDSYIVRARTEFVIQSLACFGIDENQVKELSSIQYKCERLFAVNTKSAMHPRPASINWIRDTLLSSKRQPQRADANRKLYLSRGDSSWRGVSNEPEVKEFLSAHGYDCLTLSGMSFQDQIEAFGRASHIISAHGAGLSNLVFCRPAAKVLEIFPPRWTPVCFLALAQHVGCDYQFCHAERLGLSREQVRHNKAFVPTGSDAHSASMELPLDKLGIFVGAS